ncbi:MAG: discoidin domain-containing protein [Candidatus Pacebacteria bacterium]|nr:discoidin domain-containing protein [Candidatus Paceibacterota bacterium]
MTVDSVDDGVISQDNWSLIYIDSEELVEEDAAAAVNAFDGDRNTFWISEWSDSVHPHDFRIDFGDYYDITGFRYLPRQDGSDNGRIRSYSFYTSESGIGWDLIANGTFADSANEQEVVLSGQEETRYFRIKSIDAYDSDPWASIAEINFLGTPS